MVWLITVYLQDDPPSSWGFTNSTLRRVPNRRTVICIWGFAPRISAIHIASPSNRIIGWDFSFFPSMFRQCDKSINAVVIGQQFDFSSFAGQRNQRGKVEWKCSPKCLQSLFYRSCVPKSYWVGHKERIEKGSHDFCGSNWIALWSRCGVGSDCAIYRQYNILRYSQQNKSSIYIYT